MKFDADLLDPKCAIQQLQYNQSLLGIFSQLSLGFFRWIASCFNNFKRLQLHLCLLSGFDSHFKYKKKYMVTWYQYVFVQVL